MQMSSEFLDTQQYTEASINDYASVWGEGFVSPGGADKARQLTSALELKPGDRVLDVCCGLGGSAFLMAKEFGLRVDGIDLSANMVKQAQALCKAKSLENEVHIWLGDCLEIQATGAYDAIYSRDAFLHVADKTRLFAVLLRALQPGGRLLLTDYACGPRPWSDAFTRYVADRGYTLHTVDEYVDLALAAGFTAVKGEDLTEEFISTLRSDLARIAEQGRDDLRQAWEGKLNRAQAGEQRWCMLTALKPAR